MIEMKRAYHHRSMIIEGGGQVPRQENEQPQIRRSNREHKPSTKYLSSEYILLTDEGELDSFQEAQTHKNKSSWVKWRKRRWTPSRKTILISS